MTTIKLSDTEKSIFQAFAKFYGMEQDENTNDYTKGCIATANAIIPVLTKLMIETDTYIETT